MYSEQEPEVEALHEEYSESVNAGDGDQQEDEVICDEDQEMIEEDISDEAPFTGTEDDDLRSTLEVHGTLDETEQMVSSEDDGDAVDINHEEDYTFDEAHGEPLGLDDGLHSGASRQIHSSAMLYPSAPHLPGYELEIDRARRKKDKSVAQRIGL
jgi:hypothetical protein